MSSQSVNISDFAGALGTPALPAAREADGSYAFPVVESFSSKGAPLYWRVRVAAQGAGGEAAPVAAEWLAPGAAVPAGVAGVVTTESWQGEGPKRRGGKPTVVRAGKNLGKANATNPVTQALRDALGLYNRHKKKAAGSSSAGPAEKAPARLREAAPAGGIRLPPPMLVKKLGATRDSTFGPDVFAEGVTVQRKLNGVRAPSFLDRASGRVVIYSRTGALYPGFENIRAELGRILAAPPPVPADLLASCCRDAPSHEKAAAGLYKDATVYLDGEIYLHGKSLREISGQARREDDTAQLEYHVYDCFFPGPKAAGHDLPSRCRQSYLTLLFETPAAAGAKHVRRVENFAAASVGEMEALRDRFLAEGYEGAIARKDCKGYQYGVNNYHSANLVKLKPIYDSEFEVVDYTQGSRGKDRKAVIWICKVPGPGAETFHVVPKDMSYEDRYRIFACLGEKVPGGPGGTTTRFERDFKGRPLTVEYPELSSKTGKPTQAKALAFRTYEDGPDRDPVRRLHEECAAEG